MVELQTQWATHGDITLIAGQLDNRTAVAGIDAHAVTVEPHINGEVWPPADQHLPAASWDNGEIHITVPVGSVVGIGVAGHGDPAEPPLEVTGVQPSEQSKQATTPTDILRELGDPRPTDEAIPRETQQAATPVEQSYTVETASGDTGTEQEQKTLRDRLQGVIKQ